MNTAIMTEAVRASQLRASRLRRMATRAGRAPRRRDLGDELVARLRHALQGQQTELEGASVRVVGTRRVACGVEVEFLVSAHGQEVTFRLPMGYQQARDVLAEEDVLEAVFEMIEDAVLEELSGVELVW